jgi:hypothetical protein
MVSRVTTRYTVAKVTTHSKAEMAMTAYLVRAAMTP